MFKKKIKKMKKESTHSTTFWIMPKHAGIKMIDVECLGFF